MLEPVPVHDSRWLAGKGHVTSSRLGADFNDLAVRFVHGGGL